MPRTDGGMGKRAAVVKMYKNNDRASRGYMLIELMIAVAVLAILMAISVPVYWTYMGRAQVAEAMILVQAVEARVIEIHMTRGRFPADNADADLAPPAAFAGRYVTGIEVAQGAVHVYLGNEAMGDLIGKTLSYRPVRDRAIASGPLYWVCGNASVPADKEAVGRNETSIDARYLSSVCKGS